MIQRLVLTAAALAITAACTPTSNTMTSMSNPAAAPAAVQPPAGHRIALDTLGVGEITYECRDKKDVAGQFEWVFVAPVATLYDMQKKPIGKYYGGPTWEANDGSKITGKQLAIAPATTPNSIPLQLVQTGPAMGAGAMTGITYIQRLDTKAGTAPASVCDASAKGRQQKVNYEARYVFYRP